MPQSKRVDKRRREDIKLFAKTMVEEGTALRAMRKLEPDLERKALSNKLCRWMNDPIVLKTISHEWEELKISQKDVKNILSSILFKTITKDDTKDSDVIAGCLAQAKIAGITQDSLNQVNVMLNNTSSDLSRILDGEIVDPNIDNTNNTTTNSDTNNI